MHLLITLIVNRKRAEGGTIKSSSDTRETKKKKKRSLNKQESKPSTESEDSDDETVSHNNLFTSSHFEKLLPWLPF